MADSDLNQIESVFHAALDLPAEAREAYLAEVCAGNDSLYTEVCSLLSASNGNDEFMKEPALNLGLSVLSQSSGDSMTGTVIGSYRVLSRLGKGGMGEVYLAEDTKLGRKVALKFLSPELVNDNWARRQLVREAQAVAMLDHPSVCPVYSIEENGEYTFIVMQFVEGETLGDMIYKHSISHEQIIPFARQIVGALAEAHAHGIMHRDVKPRNIMVTPGGNVKVLDFGLAKSLLPKSLEALEESVSRFSEIGVVPGTVRYMSPEQLCNERLDYRSDIFSLGTVLYEMVSGTHPFDRKTGPEIISAILTSTPKPLTQNGAASTNGLASVIERCLSKSREDRYQSASELLLDLDRLEKGIKPLPTGPPYLTLRVGALLALLLIAVVSAAILYSTLSHKKHSIAVLQLTCEGIPEADCPAPEISQQLLNHLSKQSEFVVKQGNEVPGNGLDQGAARAIGRELGVEAILSGKITKRGDLLILENRFQNAVDGATLNQHEYVLPSQLQTMPLLEELSIRVFFYPDSPSTEEEKKSYAIVAADQKRDPQALELYTRGLYYWNKRDKENIRRAIDYFNQATDRDPMYALAFAGLAECYVMMPTVAYGIMNTKDAMDKAKYTANKALTLDPKLAEAHVSLGVVQLRYEWKWQEAEKNFKQALALNPELPSAHYWYSMLLRTTRRFDEAIEESEKAKQLEPLSSGYITNLGKSYYCARDFDRTIQYFKAVISEDPTNTSAMYVLALAYFQKNMYAEAIEVLQKLSSMNKWYAAAPLGYAYAKVGRIAEARHILDEMEERAKTENFPAQERAIVYIGLGDNDSAFYWLEKSYEEHFGSIISLTSDPFFDSIKSDPRFIPLARKINLVP